jgi:hypothetical protein
MDSTIQQMIRTKMISQKNLLLKAVIETWHCMECKTRRQLQDILDFEPFEVIFQHLEK